MMRRWQRFMRSWRLAPMLTVGVALVILLAVSVLTVLDVVNQRQMLIESLDDRGLGLAQTLEHPLADALYAFDFQRLNRLVDSIAASEVFAGCEVFSSDGRRVASSGAEFHSGSGDWVTLPFLQAHPEGTVRVIEGQRELVYPIASGDDILGWLRLVLDDSGVAAEMRRKAFHHLWQGYLVALVGGLLAYLLARRITAPLRELKVATQQVALGDFSFTAGADRHSELGELGAAFEQMVDRLRDVERHRTEDQTRELQTMNEQLRDAVESARVAQVAAENAANVLTEEVERRKLTEQEKVSVIEELEAKNAELERFTYTVSHDLKSPLVTIRGHLGYLEQDALAGDETRVRNGVRRISAATDVMQALLGDLLELSRIGRLKEVPEQVSLAAVAMQAKAIVEGEVEASGGRVHIDPEMPSLVGDRRRLIEVFQNLISNAVRFAKPGQPPAIEVSFFERDGENVYFVKDEGIGIEPRFQDKVFGLFERLDAKQQGTGVGLTIVKRVVELHEGRVWVESEGMGKGTRVCFTLRDLHPDHARTA